MTKKRKSMFGAAAMMTEPFLSSPTKRRARSGSAAFVELVDSRFYLVAAQPSALSVGQRVQAKFGGCRLGAAWYPGHIAIDHGDGTFDVTYDDGDREDRVPLKFIKLPRGDLVSEPSKQAAAAAMTEPFLSSPTKRRARSGSAAFVELVDSRSLVAAQPSALSVGQRVQAKFGGCRLGAAWVSRAHCH
jgi:hypothetical protein